MLTLRERVPYRGTKGIVDIISSRGRQGPGCPKLTPQDVGLDDQTVLRFIPREVKEAMMEALEEQDAPA